MLKRIEAVYEHGRLRPLKPLELPEGESLLLIVITRDVASSFDEAINFDRSDREPEPSAHALMKYREPSVPRLAPAEILSLIASQPLESEDDGFSGKDHDSILYPRK